MQKSTKVLLTVLAGLMMLFVITVAAAIYWLSTSGAKYAREIAHGAEREVDAGRKAGESSDDSTCLRLALERAGTGNSFRDVMAANFFLNGCLQTAKETGEFCTGVPSAREIMKSTAWPITRCRELGVNNEVCRQLMRTVQVHCDEVRERGPRGSDAQGAAKEEKERVK